MLFLEFACLYLLAQVFYVEICFYTGILSDRVIYLRTIVLPCVARAVGVAEEFLALCPVVTYSDE